MRVLLVANVFPPAIGGSAVVYYNFCRNLPHDVTVLAPWRSYADLNPIPGVAEFDRDQPFRIQRAELLRPPVRRSIMNIRPLRMIESSIVQFLIDMPIRRRVWNATRDLLRDTQADVICLGELYSLSWLGHELRRRRKTPIVQFIHGEELTLTSGSEFERRTASEALRQTEAIIAVSSFTTNKLLELGVERDRIHTITNGVDTTRFRPGPASDALIRRHGLGGKKVILTVARVEPRKGQDKLIEAMPAILKNVPNAVYLVVGHGSYVDHLKNMVRQRGLEHGVQFAGAAPDEEIPAYYRTCDVFAMPNRALSNGDTEGFGLVFLEAAACGKAAVGGFAGGVPDAVIDGDTGILVDGASVDQIAEAVTGLLTDDAKRGRMDAAALAYARRCDWKEKSKQFAHVCSSVAKM